VTPEEAKRMELVFQHAKKNINDGIEELRKLVFNYDQFVLLKKYDEAEVLMAQVATASVAIHSWREVMNSLDEYETPYEAIVIGASLVMEKMHRPHGGKDVKIQN
jgi:hypothetical protein